MDRLSAHDIERQDTPRQSLLRRWGRLVPHTTSTCARRSLEQARGGRLDELREATRHEGSRWERHPRGVPWAEAAVTRVERARERISGRAS